MNARVLGKTGLILSETGFNTRQLTDDDWQGPYFEESVALLGKALELGITWFNTSPDFCKGRVERALSAAFKDLRQKVVYSVSLDLTRCGGENLRAYIGRSVMGSLERLQTDNIDILLLYRLSPDDFAVAIKEMERLKSEGRIRVCGLSFDDATEYDAVRDAGGIDCVQLPYNPYRRDWLRQIAVIAETELGILTRSPFEHGLIVGKKNEELPQVVRKNQKASAECSALYGRIRQLCTADTSPAQALLNFINEDKRICAVSPGLCNIIELNEAVKARYKGAVPGIRELFQAS